MKPKLKPREWGIVCAAVAVGVLAVFLSAKFFGGGSAQSRPEQLSSQPSAETSEEALADRGYNKPTETAN
jgi:hypothetical protein